MPSTYRSTRSLTFINTGIVQGDVLFGAGGGDTYTVQGASPQAVATHTGAINFGFSIGGAALTS